MKKNLVLPVALFAAVVTASVKAQPYKPYLNIPVTQFGNPLLPVSNAWTGGFDSPAFSQIDLDGDGIKDLFIFEKGGESTYYRYTTFINHGTANQVDYEYDPRYEERFPKGLHDWVLLVDYDCDGKEDIFTYVPGGMAVYHNDFDSNGLHFHEVYSLLYSQYPAGYVNLFVAGNSQPALVDVDNDGDLDVLTFAIASFNVEYHQNMAEENFGRCDTLVFNMTSGCWGHFGLTGNNCHDTLGYFCPNSPGPFLTPDVPQPTDVSKLDHLHSGFCAIAPDMDGDGDKEFINGDINCVYLEYFKNGGTVLSADMTSCDTLYPDTNALGNPAAYLRFSELGPYYFDADNDGKKDLIVAPCATFSKNINNVMFYKNTTSNTLNNFTYTGDSLFVNDMIDLGSGAYVALTDIDGDGLQDMIIGNYTYRDQTPAGDHSAVAYYRNTGSAMNPSFNLITTDFANLSTVGFEGLAPTFGDLDGDGDMDLIIGQGANGYLDYFENISGTYVFQGQLIASNGSTIQCGTYATPFLVDLNHDLKLDLVIGEKGGNLNYYENTGTTSSYSFTWVTDSLGKVNVTKKGTDIYGYSAPFFYEDSLQHYVLMVGSLSGFVYKYDNIDNNLAGTFNLVDSMFLYEPIRSSITGTDINGDGKMDFLVGNDAGGVKWYSNSSTVSVNEIVKQNFFNIYPNPAKDMLGIKFEKQDKHQVIITDILGKQALAVSGKSYSEMIDVSKWSSGMYVCKVVEDGIVQNKKFIVRH